MGVVCDEVVNIAGPVQTWQSSNIASRGFCATCGSSVWHKPKQSNKFTFGQGLFDDQTSWRLTREICADDRPEHYGLTDKGQKAFTGWGTLMAVVTGRLPK